MLLVKLSWIRNLALLTTETRLLNFVSLFILQTGGEWRLTQPPQHIGAASQLNKDWQTPKIILVGCWKPVLVF